MLYSSTAPLPMRYTTIGHTYMTYIQTSMKNGQQQTEKHVIIDLLSGPRIRYKIQTTSLSIHVVDSLGKITILSTG